MLSSGNGRHRRPRPTPAAVVTVATAAATGAGIALPLLGAGSAQAADTGTWNKVAVCETGGNWTADTGNGFYGGLAITQDTWDLYGGDTYAKRPDLASSDQQIAVAERILADLGPNAWPGCETGTGLLTDTAPPDMDPTSTPVPDPSGPTGILPSSPTTPTPDPTGTATTPPSSTLPADPTAPVTDPTGTPTAPPATTPPVTTAPGQADPTTPTDGSQSPGRHGKPYNPTVEQLAAADQATRTEVFSIIEGLTDDTTGTTGTTGTQGHGAPKGTTHTGGPANYTVGSGDSLISIATGHHVDGGWHHLYDVNHKVIGDDPNLIKPGEILNLG